MRVKNFLFLLILLFTTSQLKADPQEAKSGFYIGITVNVATIFTNTSYKTLFGFKGGYNLQTNSFLGVGPQLQVNFVQSPFKKGVIPSIYMGASAQMETGSLFENNINPVNHTRVSNKLSWVFPVNPSVNNYDYKDCISFTTSIKHSGFSVYRTTLDLSIDFQKYDLGFISGLSRVITFSSGASSSFIKY